MTKQQLKKYQEAGFEVIIEKEWEERTYETYRIVVLDENEEIVENKMIMDSFLETIDGGSISEEAYDEEHWINKYIS